ncbi:MAG: DUF11 domain-containing protein [Planctomycetales bacterium]|nr:DUF11 domain-containing protein [Planctomycetales bacterium]
MKAFGVRLAAGAVTILLGAIMAAQASKDQQTSTESAWTEDKIPPGKAVSPIGSSALLPISDSSDIEALKPIGDRDSDQDSTNQAVRLVQHVESAGAMGMPSIPAESLTSGTAAGAESQQSIMKMKLPSFDDAPDAISSDDGLSTAAGPALKMGLPSGDLTASAAGNQPKLSGVRFADTPDSEFVGGAQSGNNQSDAGDLNESGLRKYTGSESLQDAPPANDLRGNALPDLRASFGDNSTTNAWDNEPASDVSDEDFAGGPAFSGGPELSDSVDHASGVPAALLTPVSPRGTALTQPTFAESPGNSSSGTTLRIHREPPVQLQTGSEPTSNPASASVAARSAASLGIASQPQIVGQASAADNNADTGLYSQQFVQGAAAADDQGYAQGVAGYDASQTYNIPATSAAAADAPMASPSVPVGSMPGNPLGALAGNQYAGNQYADPAPEPQLPMPASSSFEAPPIQEQTPPGYNPQGQRGFDPMIGRAASFPSGATNAASSIYQSVGHKQIGGDRPLPAGPTLASPGERYLDGPQSPSVVIHKRAPTEVKVGKPASFVITVKNVGGSKALDVQVHDRVPTGMTLTDATPRPDPKYQPELFWELGDLEPNQERTITLQLTPEQEGELGSVARVTFQAAASVRTISTRPELKIAQRAPEKVLIGQQLEIELEVSNPGTGEATGVILQEDVPAGLEHPQGSQLDNLIGNLGPGEIRRQILRMRAVKPGLVQNQIRVKGDDGLESTHTVAVEVIAPELKATLTGPSRRFLERQATYNLEIANVGTADATNVELSVQLDSGFTFVKTDFEGQYDASRHAVFWSLPALPVGQSGEVPLTLLPVQEGDRVLRTDASADLGIRTTAESRVKVESLAELTFSINDSADPIEVGGQTIYEIRISNSGSRDDTNVQVALQLPPGLQLVEQGDFTPQGQGIIKFSPRALLKANDEITYQVKAQGIAPGRHLVKAIVTSDQSNVPVTKEESIMVYADR